MSPLAWQILVGLTLCVMNLLGVLLTALTLPGIWFMLLCAGAAQWWWSWQFPASEPLFSWWTLGVCAGLAVLAEAIEFGASAYGAAKFGGTRWGAAGSIVGALAGAVVGSIVVPLLGTIIGAAVGAGLGALLLERAVVRRTWAESGKAGVGAAVGRLAATLVKVGIAVVVAGILSVAAFV